jgi:hypothetical protein
MLKAKAVRLENGMVPFSFQDILTLLWLTLSCRVEEEVWEETMIQKDSKQNAGIKSLVKKYRAMFEIPENLNHYSKADYKLAEKKFLKYAILEGKVRT